MKKELLIASALTASFGLAGVAEAATVSYSGSSKQGVSGSDLDSAASGDSTYGALQQSNLSFSVEETTDAGTKISTGFTLVNEASTQTGYNGSGLTLTFTDGSALDLLDAGNAYGGHLASVPGASGETGIGASSTNAAPTDLDWADTSDGVGFDWSSAADFGGVDGLTVGVSAAFGDDGDTTTTATADTSYSVGATLVTTAGDSTVTIGGGFIQAGTSNVGATNDMASSVAVSASAVTGDLTVGIGYANGSGLIDGTVQEAKQTDSNSIMKAGVSYVSGDITLAIGYVTGEAKDSTTTAADGASTDEYVNTAASISYAIASGVTGVVGFADTQTSDESSDDSGESGSSWYIGATISF
jgi:hypothetical protein